MTIDLSKLTMINADSLEQEVDDEFIIIPASRYDDYLNYIRDCEYNKNTLILVSISQMVN